MTDILVVDDESSISWGVAQVAKRLGFSASTAASAEEGIELAATERPQLVFLDVRLPGMDGLTAMHELRRVAPDTKIVVMTAFGALSTAVTAVQNGALEYLIKPFNLDTIEKVMRRALTSAESSRPPASIQAMGGLVGTSQPMQEAFKRIALAAASDAPVLLSGESGTGKELAARAIHENSARREGPFVAVNLAALSESLAESELFGHVQGAYTGAATDRVGYLVNANGGTLFLDEVADIPLTLQVKLLRAIESGEIIPVGSIGAQHSNFRIIAATHQPLLDRIHAGGFRHDLYFRLAAFQIEMPPLRERDDDICVLAQYFIEQIAARDQTAPARLSDESIALLRTRQWVGNVRELRNALEHAVIVARGGLIDPDHFPPSIPARVLSRSDPQPSSQSIQTLVGEWATDELREEHVENLHAQLLQIVEPPLFQAALQASGGQFVAAAKMLGIHRTTLRKKVDEYRLEDPSPNTKNSS